jgi:hypothetical protein
MIGAAVGAAGAAQPVKIMEAATIRLKRTTSCFFIFTFSPYRLVGRNFE